MASIFVSYRRGDMGWARSLEADLGGRFDLFLDVDSVEPGDRWPTRTEDELEASRVMLVVVGPEWVRSDNLRRLADPEDWVRKELLAALAKGAGIRIVPLLVGGSKLPDSEQLPVDLREIFNRQARAIEPSSWKGQMVELQRRLSEWLTAPAVNARSAAPFQRVLPYLCNRLEQEDALELLRNGKGALVSVLHGLDLEAHDEFIERLRFKTVFEDLFRASKVGVAIHFLNWNRDEGRQGRWESLLRRALRRELQSSDEAMSDDELVAFVRAPRRPHVLVLQVTWKDHQVCGNKLIPGLIEAWRRLFAETKSNDEIEVVIPLRPMVLWINFAYPNPLAQLPFEDVDGTLPPLRPVHEGDIREWMNLRDVKAVLAGSSGSALKFIQLTKDQRWSRQDGELHMLEFAEAAERILGPTRGF